MLLRLFEQSEEHVKTVKDIKVTYSKSEFQPKTSETDEEVQTDLQRDPNRTEVAYRQYTISNRSFKLIAKMKSLSSLILSDCTFDPQALCYLKNLPLTVVDLSGTDVDDQSVQCLAKITTIRKLILSDTKCSGKAIATIQPLHDLIELDLGGTRTTDEDIKSLGALPLQRLSLSATMVTDDGMKTLSQLKDLYRLDVSRMAVSRKRIENLTAVKGLTELLLKSINLHDEDIPSILRHSKLIRLNLDENPITDKGFLQLAKLKDLIQLSIPLCPKVSDQAVAKFKELRPNVVLSTSGSGGFKLNEIMD